MGTGLLVAAVLAAAAAVVVARFLPPASRVPLKLELPSQSCVRSSRPPRCRPTTVPRRTGLRACAARDAHPEIDNGRWEIVPYGHVRATRRRYRGDTLVLETDFETADGSIRLVDFTPPRDKARGVVRLVEGVRGRVRMHMDLRARCLDGQIGPWIRQVDGAYVATAGLESVWLRSPVETRDEGFAVRADFFVAAGELVPFVLTWHPRDEAAPAPIDPFRALADAESYSAMSL